MSAVWVHVCHQVALFPLPTAIAAASVKVFNPTNDIKRAVGFLHPGRVILTGTHSWRRIYKRIWINGDAGCDKGHVLKEKQIREESVNVTFIEVIWVSPRCQASSGQLLKLLGGRGGCNTCIIPKAVSLHRVLNPQPSCTRLSAWVTVKAMENFYRWTPANGSALSCRGHCCLLEGGRGCVRSTF